MPTPASRWCALFCCLHCFWQGWDPESHTFRKKPQRWAASYFWVLLSCFPASASQTAVRTGALPCLAAFKKNPSACTAPDSHSSKSVISPQTRNVSFDISTYCSCSGKAQGKADPGHLLGFSSLSQEGGRIPYNEDVWTWGSALEVPTQSKPQGLWDNSCP